MMFDQDSDYEYSLADIGKNAWRRSQGFLFKHSRTAVYFAMLATAATMCSDQIGCSSVDDVAESVYSSAERDYQASIRQSPFTVHNVADVSRGLNSPDLTWPIQDGYIDAAVDDFDAWNSEDYSGPSPE